MIPKRHKRKPWPTPEQIREHVQQREYWLKVISQPGWFKHPQWFKGRLERDRAPDHTPEQLILWRRLEVRARKRLWNEWERLMLVFAALQLRRPDEAVLLAAMPTISGGAALIAQPAGGLSNATATWGGSTPTNADDIAFVSTSGAVTINAALACRSWTIESGYTSTITHNAAIAVSLGGSTTPPENKALVWTAAGWTYALGNAQTSKIALNSTSASASLTLDFNGKTIGELEQIPVTTVSYKLLSGYLQGVTANTKVLKGKFLTNNQNFTCGLFNSSGTEVRELNFGSSTITVLGGANAFFCEVVTNLTVAESTATVLLTGSAATFSGVRAWKGLTIKFTGGGTKVLSMAAGSAANLIVEGTAEKSGILQVAGNSTLNTTTISGKVTFKGNSTTNRVLIQSTAAGLTGVKAAILSTETPVLENVDFMDVKGEGPGGAWTGTSIGNALGNENITFTAAKTLYAKTAGSASTAATWSATEGGAGGAGTPLSQDTLIFGAAAGAGTYTMDMPRLGAELKVESGFTRTLSQNINARVFGSEIWASTMATPGVGNTRIFAGRGNHVIKNAGKARSGFVIEAPGGSYTAEDSFLTTGTCEWRSGTFNLNSLNHSFGIFTTGSAVFARELKTGTGNTITLTTTPGTIVFTVGSTSLATFAENSTLWKATGVEPQIRPGGLNFNGSSFEFTGTGQVQVSLGAFSGIKTFTRTNAAACSIRFDSGFTYSAEKWNLSGSEGALVTIVSNTGGSAFTLAQTGGGNISVDYVSIRDTIGTALIFVGTHSTIVSGTTNVLAEVPPSLSDQAVLDNFSRSNSNTVIYEAGGAALWSTGGINTASDQLRSIEGRLANEEPFRNGRTIPSYGPDLEASLEIKTLMSSSEGYVFMTARTQEPGSGLFDGYAVIFIRTGANTWLHQIRRYDNGASTVLSGTASTQALAIGDRIGLKVLGAKVYLTWKPAGGAWTFLAMREDATYTKAGPLGIELGDTTGRYDDLAVGPIPVSGRSRRGMLV